MLKRIKLFKRLRRKRAIKKARKELLAKEPIEYKSLEEPLLHVPKDQDQTSPKVVDFIIPIFDPEPKLFNIQIQLGTDPISGEPIIYEYNNVPHYKLTDTSIMMEYEGKTISSHYDIVHITEIKDA